LKSPWEGRPYTTIEDELAFAQPYRENYLTMLRSLPEQDLTEVETYGKSWGKEEKLGDYLYELPTMRLSIQGNSFSYLRILGIDRPEIWD